MVSLLLPLGLGLTLVAVALLTLNLVPARRAVAFTGGVVVERADPEKLPSTWLKWLYPVLSAFAPMMNAIRWPTYRQKAAKALQRAGIGEILSVNHLLAFKCISAVVTPIVASQLMNLFTFLPMFLLAGVGGFFIPDRLVGDIRRRREKEILRALPSSVDVLSLSVEAGLEFLLALQRQVERGVAGALRDEFATILNDIRLGKSRADALKAFAERVEIPEVSSFVSVLVQADALGASIGPVLKSQAVRMRVERFQRAEREGARASQKILFPLVLFIFPAVLIVILGPVALQFIYGR